jgi:non-ribosomal peptide synthetase component F
MQIKCLIEASLEEPQNVPPSTRLNEPDTEAAIDLAGDAGAADIATLDHLMVEAAIQCSEADALVGDFGSLTYADLLIRAQNIAVVLKRHGVGPGQYIGVAMEQSPVMITAIAGVILAGAAYVPLGRDLLEAAALRKVRASGVSLILCDGSLKAAGLSFCESWRSLGTVLDASRMEQETMPLSSEIRLSAILPEATAALVIGTDQLRANPGQEPYGVRISHRSIARLVSSGAYGTRSPGLMDFSAGETFLLQPAGQARDGIFEMWGSLLHGASLALAPEHPLSPQEFAHWIRRLGVTVLCLPVARVHEYVDQAPEVFARLRHLVIESDGRSGAISPQRVEWLQSVYPTLQIVNTYATPKIAGYATAHRIPSHYTAQAALPIGCALEGLHASILDRTGERARLRADGLLELHGHAEPQLGADAKPNATVAADGEASPDLASPPAIVASQPGSVGESLTNLFDGADQIALQPLKRDNEKVLTVERYHEKVLEQVRSLWLRLLRRSSVGYEEDFYEAGGTPIQMIRMHAELNRRFPGAISMGQLSVLTTIRKIYEHLMTIPARGSAGGLIQRGA